MITPRHTIYSPWQASLSKTWARCYAIACDAATAVVVTEDETATSAEAVTITIAAAAADASFSGATRNPLPSQFLTIASDFKAVVKVFSFIIISHETQKSYIYRLCTIEMLQNVDKSISQNN
jgi:hypothetical protein